MRKKSAHMPGTFVLSSLMTQLRKAAADRMRVSEWPHSIAADSWQYAAVATNCCCDSMGRGFESRSVARQIAQTGRAIDVEPLTGSQKD